MIPENFISFSEVFGDPYMGPARSYDEIMILVGEHLRKRGFDPAHCVLEQDFEAFGESIEIARRRCGWKLVSAKALPL